MFLWTVAVRLYSRVLLTYLKLQVLCGLKLQLRNANHCSCSIVYIYYT